MWNRFYSLLFFVLGLMALSSNCSPFLVPGIWAVEHFLLAHAIWNRRSWFWIYNLIVLLTPFASSYLFHLAGFHSRGFGPGWLNLSLIDLLIPVELFLFVWLVVSRKNWLKPSIEDPPGYGYFSVVTFALTVGGVFDSFFVVSPEIAFHREMQKYHTEMESMNELGKQTANSLGEAIRRGDQNAVTSALSQGRSYEKESASRHAFSTGFVTTALSDGKDVETRRQAILETENMVQLPFGSLDRILDIAFSDAEPIDLRRLAIRTLLSHGFSRSLIDGRYNNRSETALLHREDKAQVAIPTVIEYLENLDDRVANTQYFGDAFNLLLETNDSQVVNWLSDEVLNRTQGERKRSSTFIDNVFQTLSDMGRKSVAAIPALSIVASRPDLLNPPYHDTYRGEARAVLTKIFSDATSNGKSVEVILMELQLADKEYQEVRGRLTKLHFLK